MNAPTKMKLLVNCENSGLRNSIISRLSRENIVCEAFESARQDLAKLQDFVPWRDFHGIISQVGHRGEGLECFPLFAELCGLHNRSLAIALHDAEINLSRMTDSFIKIDETYALPINLNSFALEVKYLMLERGHILSRKSERKPLSYPVKVRLPLMAQTRIYRAENVSKGGFFATGDTKGLRAGYLINFYMHQGNKFLPPIKGSAFVKWLRPESAEAPMGFGAEFGALFGIQDEHIEKFIHLYAGEMP